MSVSSWNQGTVSYISLSFSKDPKTVHTVCMSWCQYESSLPSNWYLIWQTEHLVKEAKIHYALSFRLNSFRKLKCLPAVRGSNEYIAPCKSLWRSVSHQRASHLCEPHFTWAVSRLRLFSSLSRWMEDFLSWLKTSHHTPDPSDSKTDRWKLNRYYKESAASGRQFLTCLWKWKHKPTFPHSIFIYSDRLLLRDFSLQSLYLVLSCKYQHQNLYFFLKYIFFATFYFIFGIAYTSKLQCHLKGEQGWMLPQGYVQSYVCVQLHMITYQTRYVKQIKRQKPTVCGIAEKPPKTNNVRKLFFKECRFSLGELI